MNGSNGYLGYGNAVTEWKNLSTGAKGKFQLTITSDNPSPAEWKEYNNDYTQKGYVVATMTTVVETTTGTICVGAAEDYEDVTTE